MSIIRVLPEDVANQIAAGEVVERPASVVKELVENAVDAGAGRIVVQTRKGGQSLVQVSDDGCGMDRDDALLSIQAHATSKIHGREDIERIATLGFRGEALPSISSVSSFKLQTRRPDDMVGTELEIEGGTIRNVTDCGCPVGTTIQVRRLFYNLPGRRKFMRTPQTESAYIQDMVLMQALAHPDKAYELIADGQTVFNVQKAPNIGARIGTLLGRDVFSQMLPVEYEESGIRITGYISRPGLTRATRRDQRVFINGRPAAAKTIYNGIKDAYNTLVMKGRHPAVVLYLSMNPERVDVNVHPSKREVRFREDRMIGMISAAAVRRALQGTVRTNCETPAPAPPPAQPKAQPFKLSSEPVQQRLNFSRPSTPKKQAPPSKPAAQPVKPISSPPPKPEQQQQTETPPPAPPHPAVTPAPAPATENQKEKRDNDEIRNLTVLGVMDNGCIVAEGRSGLVLIDQKAAHSRINFERLIQYSGNQTVERQGLLMPATVDLAPKDADLLNKSLDFFQQLGFGVEFFGGNTFLITALPSGFPGEDVPTLIRDVLDEIRESPGGVSRIDEVKVAKAACKYAVSSKKALKPEEITSLIRDLARADMPYTCPNGKAVLINIPFQELDKRFGKR